ncbi:hypothetical protein BaRGS_00015988 [Batillaria attramentaria]|uniref:Protein kinase domain-containing protein n=1 Tax=Batillaria attramentaria TaxID=370345 RepID=A0ABD0L146_9CAEN
MVRRGKKGGKRHARSQEDEYCPSLSDFKTKKLLGKGGCGAVFLVRKVKGPGCGNLFAMKKIHTSSVRTAEREVLHAMSGQPFFPALHWSFLTEDSQCLVMDYVKGVEILEMMAKQRLTLAKVKFYAAELLSAVDHLHKHGIVHRDIKNDNVMVDEEGHVCLIDFGLAKRLATDQEAADLWSLGVLLFEMWAGEFPFPEDADREVTRR